MADPEGGCPGAALAEDALREALACPPASALKAFQAGLLKLAAGLDLQAASQVCWHVHVSTCICIALH